MEGLPKLAERMYWKKNIGLGWTEISKEEYERLMKEKNKGV